MNIMLIPAILATGYGISARDLVMEMNADGVSSIVFPKKQKRGDLVLGLDEDTHAVIPMIRIGCDVTVCVAFSIYVPETGWRAVDISALPGNLAELQDASEYETMELKTTDPVIDMSGYEIINAW